MTCSPAKLAANRANAARSAGPKTVEVKELSRAKVLVRGMAAEVVVQRAGRGRRRMWGLSAPASRSMME
jgi:hypothetical protein